MLQMSEALVWSMVGTPPMRLQIGDVGAWLHSGVWCLAPQGLWSPTDLYVGISNVLEARVVAMGWDARWPCLYEPGMARDLYALRVSHCEGVSVV
jgi:hypothetical protein